MQGLALSLKVCGLEVIAVLVLAVCSWTSCCDTCHFLKLEFHLCKPTQGQPWACLGCSAEDDRRF